MDFRRAWRWAIITGALVFALYPALGNAFLESTETQGEVSKDLNGVWLVVSHLSFKRPTPQPSPAAAAAAAGGAQAADGSSASPAPAPAPSPVADASPATSTSPAADVAAPARIFNVLNILKIHHVPKEKAQVARDADKKLEEAAVAKANAIIAEEQKKSVPVQSESGEVVGLPKVIVPTVPPRRQPGDGDDVDIFLLDVAFPKTINDAFDKAQKAEKPWTPTAKDLALLKSSWSTLKPSGRDEYSKIEWKVTAGDKLDEQLQLDEATKDAKFVISADQGMIPKPGVPARNIIVFGARKVGETSIDGTHVRAMMASSPFPIPIEMKGTFTMYRLADLPKAKETKETKEDGAKAEDGAKTADGARSKNGAKSTEGSAK